MRTAAAASGNCAAVTVESKLNRTAVWAISGSMPMASSTGEGASEPAAHAEPLEHNTPWRSSSSSTDSPLVPGKQKEATEGSRSVGWPVSSAPGTPASTASMNPSRRAATRPAGSRGSVRAVASATAPATFSVPERRPRSCPPPWTSGSTRTRPRTNNAPLPLGAPSLWPEMLSASTPSAPVSSGSQPAAWTASVWNGTPWARASAASRAMGWTVPTSLLAYMMLTRAVPGCSTAARASSLTCPKWSTGITSTAKPWTRSRYLADSSTAGCSTALIATRSRRGSAARRARAMPLTARLSASVPPEVKTTSPGRQPRALAVAARAPASAVAAASPRE